MLRGRREDRGPAAAIANMHYRKWFRVRNTYGVEVDPVHDDIIITSGRSRNRRDGARRPLAKRAKT